MTEIWLRTNRRILLLGMILPIVLMTIGLAIVFSFRQEAGIGMRFLGWATVGIGLLLGGIIAVQWKLPRLAYAQRQVLVYLRTGPPIRIPVEFVECFFFGSGVGQLPGSQGQKVPVRNLMMRVAEKASDYQHRPVKTVLGRWDEGYVTFHGAWCEPLTLEVVQRLNARLAEAHQAASKISR